MKYVFRINRFIKGGRFIFKKYLGVNGDLFYPHIIMPIKIRKLPHSQLYRVYNSDTKHIYAKATPLENAVKQQRFLHMLDNKKLKK